MAQGPASVPSTAEERASRHLPGELTDRYVSLLAQGVRSLHEEGEVRAEMAEHAVLFTDIRKSTQLVSTLPLRDWFQVINTSLSDQGTLVRQSMGSVVKFTGDGLMAVFRGRGRSHMALRCAMALQGLDRQAIGTQSLRIGVGIAEGLVITGLVGEPGRQQFDVIGATVHLAARLCSVAAEGEIVASPRLVRAAGFTGSIPPATRSVQLRGFEYPVECISFAQIPQEKYA